MKKRSVTILLLLFVLSHIFCTCKQEAGILATDSNHGTKTHALPSENVKFSDSTYYRCPASIGGYYFCNGKYIKYCQIGSDTAVALCIQPSCEHKDSACNAYVGGTIQQLAEYHGKLYALVKADDQSLNLIAYQIEDGERETLLSWAPKEPENDRLTNEAVRLITLANGYLYYQITQTTYSLATMNVLDEKVSCIAYDLSSGKKETLPFSNFCCVGKAGFVVQILEQEFDTKDEKYVVQESQLRLYNPETWEYEVLVDYKQDNYVFSADLSFCYGSLVSYLCGNTLYTFDAETAQTKELLTPQEPVVNYWLMDQKIFYITQKNNEYHYYYADLTDCTPVQLKNGGNTQTMEFSISYEGVDFFADNRSKVISKEDFYAENYR